MRAVPQQYDALTLKTLDNAELRQWLHHRGIEEPEESQETDDRAARRAMYNAALQYLDIKQRRK